MTRGRRAELVRQLQNPKPITYVELFFDLAFVFALFRLSEMLSERLHWSGGLDTLIVLLAAWWIWAYTNLLTDSLDSRTIRLQLLVIGSMFGTLALSAAIPDSLDARGLLFAVSYVAINLGRSGILAYALRRDELGLRPLRAAFWFAVSAVPWLLGAMVEDNARLVLWGVAITIDYLAALLGWPTPGLGRTPDRELNLASEHFAERYRQFIIIALGQTIAVTGLTFHDNDFSPHRGAAFVLCFVLSVILYWSYFHRIREKLGPSFSGARDPDVRTREAGFAHLVMVAGIVALTTADQEVISNPAKPAHAALVAVLIAGPALFLAGHALLARHLFVQVAAPRLIAAAVLVAVAPALVGLPTVTIVGLIVVILAAIVSWDLRSAGIRPGDQDLPRRL